jgi:hypothetical protein
MEFLNPPNFGPHAELVHHSVSTLIGEMYPMDFDDPNFLEPAHVHNPEIVSHIIDLPAALLQSIPNSFQDALAAIQESTSVACASSSRLKGLVKQRYSRLVPAKNQHELDDDQIWTVKCKNGDSPSLIHLAFLLRPVIWSSETFFATAQYESC